MQVSIRFKVDEVWLRRIANYLANQGLLRRSPREFNLTCDAISDVGCVRKVNEDAYAYHMPDDPELLKTRGMLLIVADGMGGHSAGEVASHMAVERIPVDYFKSTASPDVALPEAFRSASRAISEAASGNVEYRGMGCTCTALAITPERVYAVYIGDTRFYLLRNAKLRQMTEDHKEVMKLVRTKELTLAQAQSHPRRNVLSRALGIDPGTLDQPDTRSVDVRTGDVLIVCTDGLYDVVREKEIRMAVQHAPKPCETLVALARERGAPDNITVAIVRVTDQPATKPGGEPGEPAPILLNEGVKEESGRKGRGTI